jgi:hypothetical protein
MLRRTFEATSWRWEEGQSAPGPSVLPPRSGARCHVGCTPCSRPPEPTEEPRVLDPLRFNPAARSGYLRISIDRSAFRRPQWSGPQSGDDIYCPLFAVRHPDDCGHSAAVGTGRDCVLSARIRDSAGRYRSVNMRRHDNYR